MEKCPPKRAIGVLSGVIDELQGTPAIESELEKQEALMKEAQIQRSQRQKGKNDLRSIQEEIASLERKREEMTLLQEEQLKKMQQEEASYRQRLQSERNDMIKKAEEAIQKMIDFNSAKDIEAAKEMGRKKKMIEDQETHHKEKEIQSLRHANENLKQQVRKMEIERHADHQRIALLENEVHDLKSSSQVSHDDEPESKPETWTTEIKHVQDGIDTLQGMITFQTELIMKGMT
eukprot:TRINITY_DN8677_c0_g1_i2.p1 TRINITY_DN8677_c0_g1~~TRINITY_DN8677_c0_g1_i2.p1  ORF type:complete len:233 (-),score=67.79 TRINITY_DN8677_c0_g1_i2:1-699(-)